MAEANNKLGANGLVLGAQTPTEISSHDDAGTGKVLLYASGSGANAKLYYKGGNTTQRALGTDIESLPAITGSGLDAADLIMVADTNKGEGNEVKVTMTALGTFLAGDSGSGLDAGSGRLSVDVSDFISTGLEDNGNAIRLAAQGTGIAGGAGSTLSVAATQTTITSITNDAFTKIGRDDGGSGNQDVVDFSSAGSVIVKTADTARLTVADAKSTFSNAVEMSSDLEVKGNLYVSGSTTTIDTDNLRIEDALIELNSGDGGSTRASNQNAGLYISGSTLANDVTLKVATDGGRLRASAGLDVASGKDYAVDGTSVLNATTLGSAVVASSLTSVGALNAGSITADFGNIDNGASNITNGGLVKLDVDADADDLSGDSATGRLTIGAGEDLNLYHGGTNSYIVNDTGNLNIEVPTSAKFSFSVNGNEVAHIDEGGLDLADGDDYRINNVAVLDQLTLGASVTGSSLTSLGAQAETLNMNGNLVDNASGLDLTKADAGGDVVVNFQQGGTTAYAMGIDDSDSNTWKLHSATTLADTSDVELSAGGVLTINSLTATAATLSGLTAGFVAHKPLVFGDASKVVSSDADLSWHEDASHLKATGSVIVKAKNDSGASADGIAMFNSSGTRIAAMNANGLTILQGQSKVIDFGNFAGSSQAKIANGSGASMMNISSSAGLHLQLNGAQGDNNVITVDAGGNASNQAIVVNGGKGIIAAFLDVNSDRELKKDIAPMSTSNLLDKVMSLEPVSYEMKWAPGTADLGFIAQDVAKIVPEVCRTDESGIARSIDYSRLTTILAGAVQEQQVQIDDLKEIIAKLQK